MIIILMTITSIFAIFFICLFASAYLNSNGMGISVGLVAMDCPNFWEDMPEDDDSLYEARAGIFTDTFKGMPRCCEEVHGKQAAYVEARRLACSVELKEKSRNPRMSAYEDGSYPNSVGVYWELEKVEDR